MQQTYRPVKTLGRQVELLSVLKKASFLALFILIFLTSCESKNESTDQAQIKISEGNANLERMNEIAENLRADGVLIKHPSLSEHILIRKSERELQSLRKSIADYIQHAESVIAIASRPDVRFTDREKIAEALTSANRLLALIDQRLGLNKDLQKEQLTAELWSQWRTCQTWVRKNLEQDGISFRPDLSHEARIPGPEIDRTNGIKAHATRLGRQRRTRINKMAKRHIECIKHEIRLEHVFGRQLEPRTFELQSLKTNLEQLVNMTEQVSEP
jgi:hypothetical protein